MRSSSCLQAAHFFLQCTNLGCCSFGCSIITLHTCQQCIPLLIRRSSGRLLSGCKRALLLIQNLDLLLQARDAAECQCVCLCRGYTQ